jgi:class 3 adenylate cyclase
MTCPRCAFENPPAMAFCGRCGTRLASLCPSCGFTNPEGFAFCGKCGTRVSEAPAPTLQGSTPFASPQSYTPKHLAEKILTSKAALEGERKQVTVLFADLKGSMELLADRDPEEARKILDPVLERMMEAVHRYEGTVNQVMGDGIMALFGAPLAHEDHAVRACYAALRMQESVKKYAEDVRRSHGAVVKIRVGLNSGEVVVRAIGSDLRMDYTAVGQTTHLAARMEQVAEPGTALMTPATLDLAEGYVTVRALGPVPIKGFTTPVEVYELMGAGVARSRLQAAARGLTRFVGRSAELQHLTRALELAGGGHGQVVTVMGEPGVGKSRLVWEEPIHTAPKGGSFSRPAQSRMARPPRICPSSIYSRATVASSPETTHGASARGWPGSSSRSIRGCSGRCRRCLRSSTCRRAMRPGKRSTRRCAATVRGSPCATSSCARLRSSHC